MFADDYIGGGYMKRNIDGLAHVTGIWWIVGYPETTFSGHLFQSNENYHFICHTMTEEVYDKLKQVMPVGNFYSDACLNGIIRGQQVSLIGCRHGGTEYFSSHVESKVGLFEVEIVPCEIIYGDFSVDAASVVTKVTVDYRQMNQFYNKLAFSGRAASPQEGRRPFFASPKSVNWEIANTAAG